MAIGIATAIPFGSGLDWIAYWAAQDEDLFFSDDIDLLPDVCVDEPLYNKRNGATDYLVVNGTRGSYTFQCPDTAPYIAADTDRVWFSTDIDVRTATEAELIGYDYTRTIVKYLDIAPYTLEAIMILSSDVDTAKMRDDFHLSVWWNNTLSASGYVKQNRPIVGRYFRIVDADENLYTTVTIGSQVWVLQNLTTTKYNDGTAIPTGLSNANWALEDGTSGKDGAYALVNNSSANTVLFGLLYNQYAVANSKGVTPTYCRVATEADLTALITELGGLAGMGAKIKEVGAAYWTTSVGTTNSSGFSFRGGGYRSINGTYSSFKLQGHLWMFDQFSAANGYRLYAINNSADCGNDNVAKQYGYSVRCIRI